MLPRKRKLESANAAISRDVVDANAALEASSIVSIAGPRLIPHQVAPLLAAILPAHHLQVRVAVAHLRRLHPARLHRPHHLVRHLRPRPHPARPHRRPHLVHHLRPQANVSHHRPHLQDVRLLPHHLGAKRYTYKNLVSNLNFSCYNMKTLFILPKT